jgi:hypothetical protein
MPLSPSPFVSGESEARGISSYQDFGKPTEALCAEHLRDRFFALFASWLGVCSLLFRLTDAADECNLQPGSNLKSDKNILLYLYLYLYCIMV